MRPSLALLTAALTFVLPQAPRLAAAQELTVFADGPARPALEPIAAAFSRENGIAVKLVFAPSPELMIRLAAGEKTDVLLTQPAHMHRLVASGRAIDGPVPTIARIGIGLAVRASVEPPRVETVSKLMAVLMDADTIIINDVASENQFVEALERAGLAPVIARKIVRLSPSDVLDRVATSNGNVIGVGTISLIKADRRLALAGELPDAMQRYVVLCAARLRETSHPTAADRFVVYLQSPQARDLFAATGSK